MLYRTLGKTDIKVSAMGFGGIPIQRLTKPEAIQLIHKAGEKGINFIDTARGYTLSENYIGEALKGKRSKWIIATKSFARDEETMSKDIQISLKNLKTDYIDLYQFHNIKTKEEYNKVFGEGGAYFALEKAKKRGEIKHIGASSHNDEILKLLIENDKIETIMFPYNIIENQGENLFKKAVSKNIGTIAMKPLAGGMIPNASLAIKYILQNENINIAIPGMANISELDQNIKVLHSDLTLSEDERKEVIRIANDLGEEFCRRCGYCAPCPQGIDIPTMFLFKAYSERYKLVEWAKDRYLNSRKHPTDCIECGDCEDKCPYKLPIRKLLKEVESSLFH